MPAQDRPSRMIFLRECGIHVVDSPAAIGAKVKEVVA